MEYEVVILEKIALPVIIDDFIEFFAHTSRVRDFMAPQFCDECLYFLRSDNLNFSIKLSIKKTY